MNKLTPSKIFAYLITIVWIFVGIFPIVWMTSNAMKDNTEVYDIPPKMVPAMRNELYVQFDYSDMKFDEATITEAIKHDFVNFIFGYQLKFKNFKNGGANVYATYGDRLLAKAKVTSPQITEVALNNKLYAFTPTPRVFQSKLTELFVGIKPLMYFNSKTLYVHKNATNNKTTVEIMNFYKSYELNGEIKAVDMKNSFLRLFDNFVSSWITAAKGQFNVDFGFERFITNSIIVVAIAISGSLAISSLGGYALSKMFSKKTANIIILFYLGTIMIPGIMTLIPTYELFKNINMLDTLFALYIGAWFSPIAVYLFKGFFDNLPKELIESAQIDGASSLKTFLRIIVPLSKPVYGAMTIMSFVPIWNDFLWPFLVINNPAKYTFSVALYRITQNMASAPNQMMALSFIAAIPTTIIFALFQKGIQKGIVFSGIKG